MYNTKNTFVYVCRLDRILSIRYTMVKCKRKIDMARQHNSKETTELLINSAVQCFNEKGYSATTLEDIVKNVGLTRGAFYWNFSGKQDILIEIVNRYELFYRDIYESYEHFDSAYDTLRSFLLVDLKRKNFINPYVTIIRYKVEAGEEVKDLKDRLARLDDEFLAIITEEIVRGQARGELRRDRDAAFLARMIYMYLLGVDTFNSVHYIDTTGPLLSDEYIEASVAYLMSTLVSK